MLKRSKGSQIFQFHSSLWDTCVSWRRVAIPWRNCIELYPLWVRVSWSKVPLYHKRIQESYHSSDGKSDPYVVVDPHPRRMNSLVLSLGKCIEGIYLSLKCPTVHSLFTIFKTHNKNKNKKYSIVVELVNSCTNTPDKCKSECMIEISFLLIWFLSSL